MNFLLDTNTIVDFFRGKEPAISQLPLVVRKGTLSTCAINFAELLYGVHRASKPEQERERIAQFISDFHVSLLSIGKETVQIYADTKYELERKGEKVDYFDLLIASCAIEHSLVLISGNKKHFSRVPYLKIL